MAHYELLPLKLRLILMQW